MKKLVLTAEVIKDLKLTSKEFQEKYGVTNLNYLTYKLEVLKNLLDLPYIWEVMSNQYVDFDEKQREVETKVNEIYHDIERVGIRAETETKVLYFDELSNVLNERRKLKVISRSIAPIVKYCKQLAYVPQQEEEQEEEQE